MKTLFLHIPRTGGTSLISHLDGLFDKSGICPAHEQFEFENIFDAGNLDRFSLYHGHFGINFLQRLSGPVFLFTWLRKPIPRIFSTWKYLRHLPLPFEDVQGLTMVQQIQSDVRLAHSLDFPDFCRAIYNQGRLSFFNQATVLLGLGRGWEVASAGIPKVTDDLLSAAKVNLGRFDYIGFTETFKESVRELGLFQDQPAQLNSSPEAEFSYGEAFNAFLVHVTRFDEYLYQHASRLRMKI